MESYSLDPGILLGAPLSPMLPGIRWRGLRDMLHEVFSELHRGWVRRYLLDRDTLEDARLLSDKAQLSKAARFKTLLRADEAFAPGHERMTVAQSVLLIPACRVDDLGVGIAVESFKANGASDIVLYPARIVRFVVNERTRASTCASVNGDVVELAFHDISTGDATTNVCLQLHRPALLEALADADRIDFSGIERALLSSMIGICDARPGGETQCTRVAPYPFLFNLRCSEGYFKNVHCSYKCGTPISAAALFVHACSETAIPNNAVHEMMKWALRDRFSRADPVLQWSIPFGEDGGKLICDNVDDLAIDAQCLADDFDLPLLADPDEKPLAGYESAADGLNVGLLRSANSPSSATVKSVVRIAPARGNIASGIGTERGSAELEKLRKIEQRKIRKREAAARSNAKRKAKRLAEREKLSQQES